MNKQSFDLIINEITSRNGVLIIAQAQKNGVEMFYDECFDINECPFPVSCNDENLERAYLTGKMNCDYMKWFYDRLYRFKMVDSKIFNKSIIGFIDESHLRNFGISCNIIFIPKTW